METIQLRNTIDSIKEKLDIVEVIGEKIELKRNIALCPFHDDKRPSFSINTQGQYFHCFSCHMSGDVIKFFMLYEKKSFMEALGELAQRTGITLDTLTPEQESEMIEKTSMEEVLNATTSFYQQQMAVEAKEYLIKQRRLTEETIQSFRIGYANGGLRKQLLEIKKFSLDLCLKAGVLKKDKRGIITDYFYNRIILPHIKRGSIVNITGRPLNNASIKYLHLPIEMRYLYNEDDLLKSVVFLVEGFFDCLSLVQNGYDACALLGTNLKKEHVTKFSKCEVVYLCLDGDKAGQDATLKIGRLIGEKAKVVQLTENFDPDDYFKGHSKEDFEKLVSGAKPFFKYQIDNIPADIDKTQLGDKLIPILEQLAEIDQATSESYLIREIKVRFGLKTEEIAGYRKSLNQFRKNYSNEMKETEEDQPTETMSASFPGLVDLVKYKEDVAFLIKEKDQLIIKTSYSSDKGMYIPPPIDQIIWLLPDGERVLQMYEEMKNNPQFDSQLFDELHDYHENISSLPNDTFYDLFAAWDMHTYLLEQVQYTPIICLFAEPERGKSRTGKGLIYVAYRGIHVESLRDAYIVRMASNFTATIFFDVMDVWKKAEKIGTEDLLLCRFEKGATVPRVLYPERGRFKDIDYFSVFGPTIIGTNVNVHKILDTRSVQINMPETEKTFDNEVTEQSSLPLKEKLLAFRAKYMDKRFDDMPKPAKGRLGDILRPLLQIIKVVRPDREPAFLQLIQEIQKGKLIEKSASLEAKILTVIIDLESEVQSGMIGNKHITDKLNEDVTNEKYKLSYRRISNVVKAMGFKAGKLFDGSIGFFWDSGYISLLKTKYGFNLSSETSEPSAPLSSNDTDDSDCTDGTV